MGPAVNSTAPGSAGPASADARQPEAAASANTPPPAVQRVVDYLVAWGVGEASARTLTEALDNRIDPEVNEDRPRSAAMLEALDRWTDGLADELNAPGDADRVAFVMAVYGARLLDAHPDALTHPGALLDAVRGHLNVWEHGVSPKLEHQAMHRQPLGDLPMVLRGEFWSGTYRWVMPNNDKSVRPHADTGSVADAAPAPPADAPPAGGDDAPDADPLAPNPVAT